MAGDAVDPQRPALSGRMARIFDIDPEVAAFEFDREWYPWGALGAAGRHAAELVPAGQRVGVLLRNRPGQLSLLLGLLSAGACVVTINPGRGAERVRADIDSLALSVIGGSSEDLDAFAEGIDVRLVADTVGSFECLGEVGSDDLRPGVAVEMLTSGTTGPPKRVPLTYDTFSRVLLGAKHYERNQETELRLRSGVVIVNSPLVHLGGIFRVLQCVNDGRSFCLLEKFEIDAWADAVRRHRPPTVSLVPAALRMVLEADLDPADLSSIRSVISGTAPLSPDDADAFRSKYGIPVLTNYAATEFGGGVAGWNLVDHERYWEAKRGSVGRAHVGCELRVVDPDTGKPLGADDTGLLEVRAEQLGDAGWTRTTDLARIDDDGFVWIVGRADQAIIRGGFKVLPEGVKDALESDPRVRGAAVVGRADPRLGAVPVAAVELRDGAGVVGAEELLTDVAAVLARYEIPVELRIVDELPRTPSGKVDLVAVAQMFAEET
ncbi:MAG: long-chain fatty acid--CoA ligase [Acidimicrobiales bacterium]|nr:long-chain fatty acid--CoA ligase [Acidimicrobiales bacterium]